MTPKLLIAITGGTGFVGSHLIDLALAEGHQVRALTRRPQEAREGLTWVPGALDKPDSLVELCKDADAVIHVAGVINAPDAAGFEKGNVDGTLAMLAAATARGVARFVHVSSLSAREPTLSQYGGSKARSEELVESSGLNWAIVRPPAVYGPGDRETLELFKMATRGQIMMPPPGRASYIHVEDLARLLLALAAPGAPSRVVIEPDDGRAGGWSHKDFGAELARAVGGDARTTHTPRWLLKTAAWGDKLVRGRNAKLTPDRVAYFCHPDWAVDPTKGAPENIWVPLIPTEQGLADTARWYRAQGWL